MIRPLQDNVLLQFLPRPTETASGLIHIPATVSESRVGTREARVIAVGPGHTTRAGKFIPTAVKVGESVLVDSLAGQDYSMDLNAPRHNKATEWDAEGGALRMVREDEILCVVERDAEAAE